MLRLTFLILLNNNIILHIYVQYLPKMCTFPIRAIKTFPSVTLLEAWKFYFFFIFAHKIHAKLLWTIFMQLRCLATETYSSDLPLTWFPLPLLALVTSPSLCQSVFGVYIDIYFNSHVEGRMSYLSFCAWFISFNMMPCSLTWCPPVSSTLL